MKLLIIAEQQIRFPKPCWECCLNCPKCPVLYAEHTLVLWSIHELMGNFLRPKMVSPSPDNGKLYSLSTQGHSHKVPLKQLYVLSAISSIMCRKGAELECCIWHWVGGWGIPRTRKNTKEILEGQAETRRCGWHRHKERRVMEGEWKAKNRNGIGKWGVN